MKPPAGMGVVYEAEQLSLKRRVAIKVLPFAPILDPRHLQRACNPLGRASLQHFLRGNTEEMRFAANEDVVRGWDG
jgi:hypothetical protein